MKVAETGGGLPIGEPNVMSQTRSGNSSERLHEWRVEDHASAMYRVMCMYRTSWRLVAYAYTGGMMRVAAEGADVGTVRRDAGTMTASFDVEHEANELPCL